jgi:ATP-dependent DNA helicase RecQ
MVYGLQDVVRLRQMVDDSDADEEHKRHDRQKLDALLGWCEVTDCRRRPLLAYFGDEHPEHCGNCDNCLAPPATWDGTEAAQKLLSSVYRTGQRFGAAHVVDVLLGKDTEKIRQHRHEQLSVYGIGTELGGPAWRSVVRQLIVQGFLRSDQRRFGALVLTGQSRALLKGEITLQLREDRKLATSKKKRRDTAATLEAADQSLFEALRKRRKEIADGLDLPPYVIFHDATLKQMAEVRPKTEAELLSIHGVGEAKIARYGRAFLEVIAAT